MLHICEHELELNAPHTYKKNANRMNYTLSFFLFSKQFLLNFLQRYWVYYYILIQCVSVCVCLCGMNAKIVLKKAPPTFKTKIYADSYWDDCKRKNKIVHCTIPNEMQIKKNASLKNILICYQIQ